MLPFPFKYAPISTVRECVGHRSLPICFEVRSQAERMKNKNGSAQRTTATLNPVLSFFRKQYKNHNIVMTAALEKFLHAHLLPSSYVLLDERDAEDISKHEQHHRSCVQIVNDYAKNSIHYSRSLVSLESSFSLSYSTRSTSSTTSNDSHCVQRWQTGSRSDSDFSLASFGNLSMDDEDDAEEDVLLENQAARPPLRRRKGMFTPRNETPLSCLDGDGDEDIGLCCAVPRSRSMPIDSTTSCRFTISKRRKASGVRRGRRAASCSNIIATAPDASLLPPARFLSR